MNVQDMREWIEWHLYRCHFDHIHLIDNESAFDLKSLCAEYGNAITYSQVYGIPRQYQIYDNYINSISKSKWVIPIDDDEYLSVSGEFDSVHSALEYYEAKFPEIEMFAVRWKHLFPSKFHVNRTSPVLSYCIEENLTLAGMFQPIGDRGVKTFVKRTGKVHYEETRENPNGGHVPIHERASYAIGFDGRHVTGIGFDDFPIDIAEEKLRILHCRYKGPDDWKRKYIDNHPIRISDNIPHEKKFLFTLLLNKLP